MSRPRANAVDGGVLFLFRPFSFFSDLAVKAVLSLQYTQVGDVGLKQLAGLSRLRDLVLFHTNVTDAIVPTLSKLNQLMHLLVGETAITNNGIRKLKAALPLCEID